MVLLFSRELTAVIGVSKMRWKNKYIAGITIMSMFFTLPLVSAEEDEIVVYGGEFEPEVETTATNENSTANEGNVPAETPVVETPEEQITKTEKPAGSAEGTQTESPVKVIENVVTPEIQEPIEDIKPEVEVKNLSVTESGNDGDSAFYTDNDSTYIEDDDDDDTNSSKN